MNETQFTFDVVFDSGSSFKVVAYEQNTRVTRFVIDPDHDGGHTLNEFGDVAGFKWMFNHYLDARNELTVCEDCDQFEAPDFEINKVGPNIYLCLECTERREHNARCNSYTGHPTQTVSERNR